MYCYEVQKRQFGDKYLPLPQPVEYIAKALSKERFGGTCAFNLCGNGETLFHPDVVPLVELLLQEGHYVSIVTNGTVRQELQKLIDMAPDLRERLFIKFSFHYIELNKAGLLTEFAESVKRARLAGISITVELVASEYNIPYIEEIKSFSIEHFGALCHATDARNSVDADLPHLATGNLSEYQAFWEQLGSALYEYRQKTWGKSQASEFCYSGEYSFALSLKDGMLKQCYRGELQNIFDDVEEPIHTLATGKNCPFAHCYNSHVWDCFVGVIPEIATPTYAELRDRVCADGSKWLTEKHKAWYSLRVCDSYAEYDENRKVFTDGIMAIKHRRKEPDPLLKNVVETYLEQACIRTVCIHGNNAIAKWVLSNVKGAKRFTDNIIADVIIVTDYESFSIEKKKLERQTAIPIISVVDIPVYKGVTE
jgi:hypothetical protein